MRHDDFLAFERDCIRRAAGRPDAEIRPVEHSDGLRSRCYLLEGPAGGSFVKCLDAGFKGADDLILTLGHEAEGYRLFSGWAGECMSVPEVHFCETFFGPQGQELQVLGTTNVAAAGPVQSLRTVLLGAGLSPAGKETLVAEHAKALARLCSPGFQSGLDRSAAAAGVRERSDHVIDHPNRAGLLARLENHTTVPWAYENKIIGEMNVFLPRWIETIARHVPADASSDVQWLGDIFSSRPVIEALAPGQSSDRLIFSPGDRNDGNSLLRLADGRLEQMFEVDFELWGLETIGRMIGRYAAIQLLVVNDGWSYPERQLGPHAKVETTGALLYHFILGGSSADSESVWRAVGVGVGNYYAAIMDTYLAAVFPGQAAGLVKVALSHLEQPDRLLKLAALYAETRPDQEAEPVLETIGQVWMAMQPLTEVVSGLLDDLKVRGTATADH